MLLLFNSLLRIKGNLTFLQRRKNALFCQEWADFRAKNLRLACDSYGFALLFGANRTAISMLSHRDTYAFAMRKLCYRNAEKNGFSSVFIFIFISH